MIETIMGICFATIIVVLTLAIVLGFGALVWCIYKDMKNE